MVRLARLLVFFAVIGGAVDVDAGRMHVPRRNPVLETATQLLFHADIWIFAREKTHPQAEGVVLRWGRQYWPLSEFGECFAELRTP